MSISESVPAPAADALAVVVVSHQSAAHLPALAHALLAQLRDGDELVIVDNASTDGSAESVRALEGRLTLIESGQNLGFAAGCHAGASATRAPLLLFLNPDSRPHEDCVQELRAASARHPDWGAWQAAVLLDERHINTSGGVVHYLGFGWAGQCGRALSELPTVDREVAFPSGAAMVVRRSAWEGLGGFDREFFMYAEDLDLGLRLWLAGYRAGIVPAARVVHDYEFDKGAGKWFYLERNRWRMLLSVYPAPLLVLLAPALVAAELGLLAIAARQGWLAPKLRAQLAAVRGLPRALVRRRSVQRLRRTGARRFANHLTSSLDSSYLEAASTPLLRLPQAFYWRAVLLVLAAIERER